MIVTPNKLNNQTPLTAEQQEMAARFMPLAFKQANWHASKMKSDGYDDILSAAMWGCVVGARGYQPDRGASLWTYMKKSIDGCILTAIKTAGPLAFQYDRLLEGCGEAAESAVDRVDDRRRAEAAEEADRVLGLVSERERMVVEAHHLEGETFVAIGKRIGRDSERVRQIYNEALAKMRFRRERQLAG
jgi:RNA polymerase sigma factor (sigma-70 family)